MLVFVFARMGVRGGVRVVCVCVLRVCLYVCVFLSVCTYVLLLDMNTLFHASPTDRINMDIRSTDGINTHTHTTPNGLGAENEGSGANQAHANTQTQTRKRNSHTQKQRARVQQTQGSGAIAKNTAQTRKHKHPGAMAQAKSNNLGRPCNVAGPRARARSQGLGPGAWAQGPGPGPRRRLRPPVSLIINSIIIRSHVGSRHFGPSGARVVVEDISHSRFPVAQPKRSCRPGHHALHRDSFHGGVQVNSS